MQVKGEIVKRLLEKRGAYPEWCVNYGEPGYDSAPEHGILFANWNHVNRRVQDWLEHHGYAREWSDEWIIEHKSSKGYRTSPDCYSWKPSYVLLDNCEIIGRDEIESGDQIDKYTEHLLNDSRKCDTFDIDWIKHDFVKLNDDSYENGWHPGQNDRPDKILAEAQKSHLGCDFLFSLDENSQFYSTFSIWKRERD